MSSADMFTAWAKLLRTRYQAAYSGSYSDACVQNDLNKFGGIFAYRLPTARHTNTQSDCLVTH